MSATGVIEIETTSCTLHNRCRTPVSAPIKSHIVRGQISRCHKGRQGCTKQESFGDRLRRGKWGYRESRGNNERTHECHAHLLCPLCVRIKGGNGTGCVYFRIVLSSRAISTAPMAASSPLLSMPGPLRSMACCSVLSVRTPNITGIPVDICAS